MRSIEAAHACFDLHRLTGGDGRLPVIAQAIVVMGMDRGCPAPVHSLFRREARILKPPLVEKFGAAVGAGRPSQYGHGVDDQAEVAFAGLQDLLSALAVVDVGDEKIPAGNYAVCIAHGTAAVVEPSIHSVYAAKTDFGVEGSSGRDRLRECGDLARTIIGMNGIAEGPISQFLEGLAEIVHDRPVDKLGYTVGAHGAHKARNAVDDLAEIDLTGTQRLLNTLAILDLLFQFLVGCGKTCGSFSDSLLQFIGDLLLFAQEACLLQSDRYLIGHHTQKQSLRLRGEISWLGSGYDDSKFALDSQMHGYERSLLPTEMAAYHCRPLPRVISESLMKSVADRYRILCRRVRRCGP